MLCKENEKSGFVTYVSHGYSKVTEQNFHKQKNNRLPARNMS